MLIRRIVFSLLVALTLSVTGQACFGKFAATRALLGWNQSVSPNKLTRTLVMWGLFIIPVYELFTAGDLLIFNVIEFWDGRNPLADAGRSDGNALAAVEITEDEQGRVTIRQGAREYLLEPVGPRHFRVYADGRIIGSGELHDDQSVVLYDIDGAPMRVLAASELDGLSKHL